MCVVGFSASCQPKSLDTVPETRLYEQSRFASMAELRHVCCVSTLHWSLTCPLHTHRYYAAPGLRQGWLSEVGRPLLPLHAHLDTPVRPSFPPERRTLMHAPSILPYTAKTWTLHTIWQRPRQSSQMALGSGTAVGDSEPLLHPTLFTAAYTSFYSEGVYGQASVHFSRACVKNRDLFVGVANTCVQFPFLPLYHGGGTIQM